MDRILFLAIGCAVLTYSLAHLYRLVAIALRIVDQPNERSAHKLVTPSGAGLSFILVFCLSLAVIYWSGSVSNADKIYYEVMPGLLLLALVGLMDDIRPLSWKVRAPIHFVAAGWVIVQSGFPTLNLLGLQVEATQVGLVFGVFALVWLSNLYNFMDGIDGLAISEVIFALSGACLIALFVTDEAVGQTTLALIGCCAGFLVINWPTAKVFMGDIGSGFLGLLLGALLLSETLVSVWTWLILLGWFISDACLTILARLFRGEKIYEAHSQHAYQHLNRSVGTPGTLAFVMLINTLWLLPVAAIASIFQDWAVLLLVLAYTPLLIYQYYCGAGRPAPKLMKGTSS